MLVEIAWDGVEMVGLDAGLVVFCDARVYEPGGFWWDATVWVGG